LHLGSSLKQSLGFLIAAGWLMNRQPLMASLLLAGPLLAFILGAVWRFVFFRYAVTEEALRWQAGWWQAQQRMIPWPRVHQLNMGQNAFSRILGVYQLTLETPGGEGAEATFRALTKRQLEEIRHYYQKSRVSAVQDPLLPEKPEQLWRLSAKKLILAGLTANSLAVFLGAIAFLFQRFDDWLSPLDPHWSTAWDDWSRSYWTASFGQQGLWLVMGFALILFLALVLSIGHQVLRFAGFTLTLAEQELSCQGGLVSRKSMTVSRTHIQALAFSSSWLQRATGFSRCHLIAAGSQGAQTQEQGEQMIFPLVTSQERNALVGHLWPSALGASEVWQPLHPLARRHLWWKLVALWVGICLFFAWQTPWLFVSGIHGFASVCGGILLAFLLAHSSYRQWGWQSHGGFLWIRRGVIGLTVWVVPMRLIQVSHWVQTPLSRRKGALSVAFGLMGLDVGHRLALPFLYQKDAQALFRQLSR
jgi:putative membrane protein